MSENKKPSIPALGMTIPRYGELLHLEAGEQSDFEASSFDLLNGLDVTEDADTVPGALLDELFKPGPA